MLASYVYTLLVIFGILSTLFVAGIGRMGTGYWTMGTGYIYSDVDQ